MPHDSQLISTLAVSLAYAFVGGLVAHRLRLSPIVGYLLAGIAVGPFTPGFVADAKLAGELAEVGVALLMFGVGMHFSLDDLLAVRRIAVPGAIAQIAVATALGAMLGHAWGWPLGAGLVFGLALSVASTVVLLRALEAHKLLDSPDGRIAVGWLVVEDMAMVFALLFLPVAADLLEETASPEAARMAWDALLTTLGLTLLKMVAFVGVMLAVGTRVAPWLLAQVDRAGSRELHTLAVIAMSLGVAFAASALFGMSFALGAFFAGVVLHDADHGDRVARDAQPLQDAFTALFFVSVGMLFDPAILLEQPLPVLAVLAIIVLGKSLAAFLIALAFRHPPHTALIVAASLAQIGEFSFILVGMGTALGLLPDEGKDIILAGALLSIMLNPFLFRAAVAWNRQKEVA